MTCQNPPTPSDQLLRTLVSIARTPLSDYCVVDVPRGETGEFADVCGRPVVEKCPRCLGPNETCEEHLYQDKKRFPDFPQGVCDECYFSEVWP